jgi:hypothetical protein
MGNVNFLFWLFWLIAVAISVFQGYRGYLIQLQFVEKEKNDLLIQKASLEVNLKSDLNISEEKESELMELHDRKFVYYAKTNCQTVCLRAIPYCFFYFITTLLGFIALFFVYYILNNTCNLNDISGGTAALVIFAILYGIIGITGQLPTLIEQGKLPK